MDFFSQFLVCFLCFIIFVLVMNNNKFNRAFRFCLTIDLFNFLFFKITERKLKISFTKKCLLHIIWHPTNSQWKKRKKEDFQSKRGKKRRTIFGQYNINKHSYKSQDKSEHAFIQAKNACKILVQNEKFKTVSKIY